MGGEFSLFYIFFKERFREYDIICVKFDVFLL